LPDIPIGEEEYTMCECCRRLLALLRIVQRDPPPFGVLGDDAVLDAWFGRRCPAFRDKPEAAPRTR
jgi:hypothetical protein